MSVDINKHEVDIDILKKQNVNDLLSIKELYERIEELGEKITQIKYIDNTLVKKLKKEYEKLKNNNFDEDFILNKGKGVVLTSPNNSKYRLKVDNSGNLTTEQI